MGLFTSRRVRDELERMRDDQREQWRARARATPLGPGGLIPPPGVWTGFGGDQPQLCRDCGALTMDAGRHAAWHTELRRVLGELEVDDVPT